MGCPISTQILSGHPFRTPLEKGPFLARTRSAPARARTPRPTGLGKGGYFSDTPFRTGGPNEVHDPSGKYLEPVVLSEFGAQRPSPPSAGGSGVVGRVFDPPVRSGLPRRESHAEIRTHLPLNIAMPEVRAPRRQRPPRERVRLAVLQGRQGRWARPEEELVAAVERRTHRTVQGCQAPLDQEDRPRMGRRRHAGRQAPAGRLTPDERQCRFCGRDTGSPHKPICEDCLRHAGEAGPGGLCARAALYRQRRRAAHGIHNPAVPRSVAGLAPDGPLTGPRSGGR